MPIFLIFVGLLLIVVASRDKIGDLTALLKADFSGPNNFFYWLAALVAVGAIGYSDAFKNFSRAFLGLILLSMILANKGFFAQLTAALANVKAPPAPSEASTGQSTPDQTAAQSADAANPRSSQNVARSLGDAVSQGNAGAIVGNVLSNVLPFMVGM